jgi:hypothetical protein
VTARYAAGKQDGMQPTQEWVKTPHWVFSDKKMQAIFLALGGALGNYQYTGEWSGDPTEHCTEDASFDETTVDLWSLLLSLWRSWWTRPGRKCQVVLF